MGLTGWTINDYLRSNNGITIVAEPFLVSIWGYAATGSASYRFAYSLGILDSDVNRRRLGVEADDSLNAQIVDATTGGDAQTGNTHPNNTWFHMAGAFVSSTLRSAWLNGGSRVDEVTSLTPSAPTRNFIGRAPNAEFPWSTTGALAELSLWDCTGFTSGNRDSLVTKLKNGGNPITINAEAGQAWSGKLKGYWPMTAAGTQTDQSSGGNNFNAVGTLTVFGSHPTIDPLSSVTIRTFTMQRGT